MPKTNIQWTDESINPIRARRNSTSEETSSTPNRTNNGWICVKISPGCTNCYASKLNENTFFGNGLPFIRSSLDQVESYLDESALSEVLQRRKPTKYFWVDMSDLFGDWVPDAWIDRCFATMALTPQHIHQVLTKRPERMLRYLTNSATPERIAEQVDRCTKEVRPAHGIWPIPALWLGVSVEDQQRAEERIPPLLQTPASIRFLSCEPLLEGVDLTRWFDGTRHRRWYPPQAISWVIVGAESGTNARSCDLAWVRSLVEQCRAAGAACFVKQLGRKVYDGDKAVPLRDKKGGDPEEWPTNVYIREYPVALRPV